MAGLTVGVMLSVQGLGYAIVAGFPPIYGLFASVAPVLVYAATGTARQIAVGPVAVMSLLVGDAVIKSTGKSLTSASTDDEIDAAMRIAFAVSLLVGIMQLVLGVLRVGFVVDFLSHPVLSGFTSAAGAIIGASQLKHVFGVKAGRGHGFVDTITFVVEALERDGPNWSTFGLCLGSLVILLVMRAGKRGRAAKSAFWLKAYPNFLTQIPSQLVVVVLGIVLSYTLDLGQTAKMSLVGDIPRGIVPFSLFLRGQCCARCTCMTFPPV